MNMLRCMSIVAITLVLTGNTLANTDPFADLDLTKIVNKAEALEGDTMFFTIELTNNGPDGVDVIVEDILPIGLSFQIHSVSPGMYTWETGVWDVGTLSNGQGALLLLWALVEPGTLGQTLCNTALATGSVNDPNLANNMMSAEVTVVPEPATLGLLLLGSLAMLRRKRST